MRPSGCAFRLLLLRVHKVGEIRGVEVDACEKVHALEPGVASTSSCVAQVSIALQRVLRGGEQRLGAGESRCDAGLDGRSGKRSVARATVKRRACWRLAGIRRA